MRSYMQTLMRALATVFKEDVMGAAIVVRTTDGDCIIEVGATKAWGIDEARVLMGEANEIVRDNAPVDVTIPGKVPSA